MASHKLPTKSGMTAVTGNQPVWTFNRTIPDSELDENIGLTLRQCIQLGSQTMFGSRPYVLLVYVAVHSFAELRQPDRKKSLTSVSYSTA